jgi:hypothetical protein
MTFYTTESLGKHTSYTPEGFLVCKDVAIGRIGMMLYGPGETPVEVGGDGVARIERDAAELFKPETIASFNGKPVTNDHPTVGVTVDNWRDLAMGYVMNTRRGSGTEDDLMLADLVLTDKGIIEEVLAGKRDVSSGYDNDYYQTAPGFGRQVNIIGNHVALVQRGRCGSRCSIKDQAHSLLTTDCGCKGDSAMPVMFKDFVGKVKKAFANAKNEKELDEALAEIGTSARSTSKDEEGIHIHAGGKYDDETLDSKFKTHDDAIQDHENRIGELEKPKTQDAAFDKAVNSGIAKALDKLGLTADRIKFLVKTADKAKDAACPDCDGTGKKDGKECEKCGGTGEITQDAARKTKDEGDCPECDGTGKIDGKDCPACDGTGNKKEPESEDKALDAEVAKEEPKAKGSKDSAYFAENFQATVAMAEIISPGIHIPTFDRAAKPGDTFTQICGLRRKALSVASKDKEMAEVITKANGGQTLDEKGLRTASCDRVREIFTAVGEFKKVANNKGALDGVRLATAGGGGTGVSKTISEVNAANRKRRW